MGENKRKTDFVFLPCLRCGKFSVIVPASHPPKSFEQTDLFCNNDECGARHFLSVQPDRVTYDRDTRRYSGEHYDDNDFPVIKLQSVKGSKVSADNDSSSDGPIIICRRKRYFSRDELRAIFKNSNGKCHLCKKRWALSDRSKTGWHIDHVIPNAGGGYDTEEIENFRVACSWCNLKKGRGYTFRTVRLALKQLLA